MELVINHVVKFDHVDDLEKAREKAAQEAKAAFDAECLEPTLVLDLPLCWWWYSNECLVDEGIL